MDPDEAVRRLVPRVREDERVLALFLFGSHARGDAWAESDVDVCLVLEEDARDQGFDVRVDHADQANLDVQVFQDLPLYIRKRVLDEGEVRFVRDPDRLYEVAHRFVREWEDFRPIYRSYLEAVAAGT